MQSKPNVLLPFAKTQSITVPRIFPEVVNVEHCLRIREVREVDREAGVDAVAGTKVGDAARHGNLEVKTFIEII